MSSVSRFERAPREGLVVGMNALRLAFQAREDLVVGTNALCLAIGARDGG